MDHHPDKPAAAAAQEILLHEVGAELQRILIFWKRFAPDRELGGFAGQVDQRNNCLAGAPKGAVLNTRILWTFSAAYQYTRDPSDLLMARRAYEYILIHFSDPLHGGLYWSVDAAGNALDTHKQVYAQAFGIYGMSEYYRATGVEEALAQAIDWYRILEASALDPANRGYTDAFTRDWSFLADMRLSEKDSNAPKTMNTHLHLVEAYANLYEVWPDARLRMRIEELLAIFQEKILDSRHFHLNLFFKEDWTPMAGPVSYGHDIEASWLLSSCAATTGNELWLQLMQANALRIADAAMEGLDTDGGLWNESEMPGSRFRKEKHWWPQAEALVGFCHAWQVSGERRYFDALLASWKFIRRYIADAEHGEWFWGVDDRYIVLGQQDKIGFWKCPYHNSRACLELLKRLSKSRNDSE